LDLLKGDSALIWKNEPSARRTYLDVFSPVRTAQDRIDLLRRFIPTVPEEFRANHTWAVRINSDGYRGEELSVARGPSTVRIACVGDSWTFGMPVGQEQTYPSRVAAWLHQERPDLRYEVQNFGVLGYSSFQGLQLLKSRVLDFHPDVVVIGFGMNDSEVAGYRDKDIVAGTVHPTLISRVKETAGDAASTSKARFLTVAPGPPRVRIQSPSATTSKPKPGQRRRRRLDYDSSAMDARVPARLRVERCEMIRLAGAAPPSC
jgi:lysophospholipase L1-like esterase